MMSLETITAVKKLIEHLQAAHCPQSDLDLVRRACDFADKHYCGIMHPTDKPYIQYASEVAMCLYGLNAGPIAVCAAMIYPPPIVAEKVLDDIKTQFENEQKLVRLVQEMLHLSQFEWDIWQVPLDGNENKERRQTLKKMFLLAIDEIKSEPQEHFSLTTASEFQKKEKQVENVIRLFLAVVTDIRALVIMLADRLYFIKLLKDLLLTKQITEQGLLLTEQALINYRLLAKITLAIYAPLADRLGMWQLKSELEDMSFRLIEPVKYKEIAKQLAAKKQEREKDINDNIIPVVQTALVEYGIEAEITGRAKHIYSIYDKMVAKQLEFNQINDLLGIRILVDSERDCYDALEIILDKWPAKTDVYDGEAYRDWIANPKANRYQSIHTTVTVEVKNKETENKIIEIQIRTREMHEVAEYGVASAHWRYKESKAYRKGKTPRVLKMQEQVWSQQLAELRKGIAGEEKYVEQESFAWVERGSSNKRIFMITPEGHVIDLPSRATLLDFAYRIHTDLGHRYTGAKVGDHLVRLDYELKNGDIVELITSRARKGPSPEWLSISKDEEGKRYYIYARTRKARSKIRHWFRVHDEMQKV